MEASRQMTLQAHFAASGPLRPIMTSLNGDNSWLLSFPRPDPDRMSTGRAYYHILFEPWLNGPTNLLSEWFVFIQHEATPAVCDAEGVYAVVHQIEETVARARAGKYVKGSDDRQKYGIDAILLGFHYLDHLHEPTLRLFNADSPVIATPEVIAMIKPWNYFTNILSISNFDSATTSWQDKSLHPGDPFPSWLSVVRLLGHHELNYVTAITWSHAAEDGTEIHETIMQTPHGTKLDIGPLQAFMDSEPRTQKLAMLHGLKESRAGGVMNTYGAAGGLSLYRRIGGAKYWILSHHSKLGYSGFFMWLLWVNDRVRTVQWALEQEAKAAKKGGEIVGKGGTPNVVEVDNGGCFVLA